MDLVDLTGCAKRPSSKAAASEEARRTLRYVEPLSDARTMLAVFFSILLANHNLWRFFCLPGLSYFVNFYRGLDQIVQLLKT